MNLWTPQYYATMDDLEKTEASQPTRRLKWELIIPLAPVIVALLSAMFYLNGRAFFFGYLGYFHLEPTLFGDDLGGQVYRSVVAWLYVGNNIATWINAQIRPRSLWLFCIPLLLPIVLGVVGAVGRLIQYGVRSFGRKVKRRLRSLAILPRFRSGLQWVREVLAIPAFAHRIMRGLGMAYIVGYGAYILIWVLILVLVFLVSPFDAIGRSVAATDAAENFQDSPLVEIKSPSGVVTQYRLILCAPRFCAVYGNHRALAVPAKAMTWAVSPLPGDLPKVTIAPPKKP